MYLFLRESHTSLSQEQGWFGMSRETEMCFLLYFSLGKEKSSTSYSSLNQHSLYIITSINTHYSHQSTLHLFKHSFYLPSSPSFLSRRRLSLSTRIQTITTHTTNKFRSKAQTLAGFLQTFFLFGKILITVLLVTATSSACAFSGVSCVWSLTQFGLSRPFTRDRQDGVSESTEL